MSTRCLCVTACLALCGISYLFAAGQAPAPQGAAPAPPQAQRPVQKWEYRVVATAEMIDYNLVQQGGKSAKVQRAEALAKLGDEGWELVTVDHPSSSGANIAFYFKRPK